MFTSPDPKFLVAIVWAVGSIYIVEVPPQRMNDNILGLKQSFSEDRESFGGLIVNSQDFEIELNITTRVIHRSEDQKL